jgi:hypothetical protein
MSLETGRVLIKLTPSDLLSLLFAMMMKYCWYSVCLFWSLLIEKGRERLTLTLTELLEVDCG